MIPCDMITGFVHQTKNHGDLEVVKYMSSSHVDVRFLDTGYQTSAESGDIRKGNVRDLLCRNIFGVGYCGVGRFKQSVGGKKSSAYSAWYNMLLRCYSDKHRDRYPTYSDVYVCDDWHNFQTFAEWYEDNKVSEMELDKDIKVAGNRIYSPDTCMFVSQGENKKYARQVEFSVVSPSGEIYHAINMSKFCKKFGLQPSKMSNVLSGKRHHHKGWTAYVG
jgi:hypothetical protein